MCGFVTTTWGSAWRPISRRASRIGSSRWTNLALSRLGTDDKEHSANIAAGMQDYLICVEMLFAAAGHSYAFSASEFEVTAADPTTPGRSDGSVWNNLTHMLSTEDVREEVYGAGTYGAMRLASLPEESYRALSEGTTSLLGRLKPGGGSSMSELQKVDEDGIGGAGYYPTMDDNAAYYSEPPARDDSRPLVGG